jgi:hypothetical protein
MTASSTLGRLTTQLVPSYSGVLVVGVSDGKGDGSVCSVGCDDGTDEDNCDPVGKPERKSDGVEVGSPDADGRSDGTDDGA